MKITYLIGAGASAHAVPTSNKFNEKLQAFLNEIKTNQQTLAAISNGITQLNVNEVINQMTTDCAALMPELMEHTNVDIYGRQLFLTSQTEKLRQLKALVSAFLILHQLENKPDKRYNQFVANILEKNDKNEIHFPMELLLLSWNYDFQLELAAADYLNEHRSDHLQEMLNFYPRVQVQDLEREMLNKFSVIKLNGTVAGWIPDEHNYLPLEMQVKQKEQIATDELRKRRLLDAVLHYQRFTDPKNEAISDIMYAWESSTIQKRMKSYLKYKSYNTDVLVIIGYSFPTFNRRFDREMLANMQLLKEVCIQAPANDIQGIADRFTAILGPERIAGVGRSSTPIKMRLVEMKSAELDEEFYVPFQATTF